MAERDREMSSQVGKVLGCKEEGGQRKPVGISRKTGSLLRLAAILLSGLAKARESARRCACANNLKQLWIGGILFC